MQVCPEGELLPALSCVFPSVTAGLAAAWSSAARLSTSDGVVWLPPAEPAAAEPAPAAGSPAAAGADRAAAAAATAAEQQPDQRDGGGRRAGRRGRGRGAAAQPGLQPQPGASQQETTHRAFRR